jgi:hypothetical protein
VKKDTDWAALAPSRDLEATTIVAHEHQAVF